MMNQKTYTTQLAEDELSAILQAFDLGSKVQELTRINGGLANTNLKLVTEKNKYLLKVCDEKTLSELQTQTKALQHMKKHGYFTAFPHPIINTSQKDSEFVFVTPAHHRVIVYDFLSGKPVKFEEVTPKIMSELGTAVAKLHLLPNFPGLSDFPMGVSAIEPFFEDISNLPISSHPFVTFMKNLLEKVKPIINDPNLPQGIMHADLFADNTLFEQEQLVAVIDWEEISYGPLILDVAMTICGCCYADKINLDKNLMDAFLESYQKTRPLSEFEVSTMSDFIDYANLAVAFWRFRQFNVRTPDEELRNKYKEIAKRFSSLSHDLVDSW